MALTVVWAAAEVEEVVEVGAALVVEATLVVEAAVVVGTAAVVEAAIVEVSEVADVLVALASKMDKMGSEIGPRRGRVMIGPGCWPEEEVVSESSEAGGKDEQMRKTSAALTNSGWRRAPEVVQLS